MDISLKQLSYPISTLDILATKNQLLIGDNGNWYIDNINTNIASGIIIDNILPENGNALLSNHIYVISSAINTYTFIPPINGGYTRVKFITANPVNITFSSDLIFPAIIPTISSFQTYELNIFNNVGKLQLI